MESVPVSLKQKYVRAPRIPEKNGISDSTDWSSGSKTTNFFRPRGAGGLMCFYIRPDSIRVTFV